MRLPGLVLFGLAMTAQASAADQAKGDTERIAVLEIGAAPEFSLAGSKWSAGPTVAVEVTPIENWLELEMGITPTFHHGSVEWETDLLFKKPWSLSKKIEFMFGAGPEWLHSRERGVSKDSLGGAVALDFMFWNSPKSRFGFYFEPTYGYDFGKGHEKSIGVEGGILIAIR